LPTLEKNICEIALWGAHEAPPWLAPSEKFGKYGVSRSLEMEFSESSFAQNCMKIALFLEIKL
jgi:hypothetical protein